MIVYILLIVAAFIVATTFVAGKAVNIRRKAAEDHAYRMTQLRFAEDENTHRRYLEAATADRTPSDAELSAREAEAKAKTAVANAKTAETNARLKREMRSRY